MRLKELIIASLFAALTIGTAQAEVDSIGETGFTIKSNVHLKAGRSAAFAQLIQIGDWWFDDHTWFGSSQAMQIEEHAGGCWCETAGKKSAVHGIVSQIDPGNLLRLNAALGPLQEQAVSGVLTFKLEDMGSGAHLYVTYKVNGFSADEANEWAPIVDFVINEQVTRYGRLINTGKAGK